MKKRGQRHILYRLRRVQEARLRPRAVALGHGFADAALRDLRRLERAGGAALPTDAGQGAEQANETAVRERRQLSWSTSMWLALQAQRLSVAVHIASAWEIATEMQLAGGGGEAPSSDEEGAATA